MLLIGAVPCGLGQHDHGVIIDPVIISCRFLSEFTVFIFEEWIVSETVGEQKPARAMFDAAMEKMGLTEAHKPFIVMIAPCAEAVAQCPVFPVQAVVCLHASLATILLHQPPGLCLQPVDFWGSWATQGPI